MRILPLDRRTCSAVMVLLLALAAPLTVRAAGPAPSAPADCPADGATLETLIGLRLEPGPLASDYGGQTNETALACFGSASIRFDAFVASPEGLGSAVGYGVDPAWLDTWGNAGPYLAASDREVVPGAPVGPFYPVAVPPARVLDFEALDHQWVSVTGQFDVPEAASCTADLPPRAGMVPTRNELVRLCRTSFVVTAIEPTIDPCPSEATVETIIDTPESSRADCFGGRELLFTAIGYAINNIWPGISLPPELLPDWVLRADGRDDTLPVSVPGTVALPDPSGTPWANSDTVGSSETLWQVTGHFDDQAAGACFPEAGDTVDGRPVALTLAQVRTFCRNRLVVDRLVWLPAVDAAGSPLASKATPSNEAPDKPDAVADQTPMGVILIVVGLSVLVFVIAAVVAGSRARRSS